MYSPIESYKEILKSQVYRFTHFHCLICTPLQLSLLGKGGGEVLRTKFGRKLVMPKYLSQKS